MSTKRDYAYGRPAYFQALAEEPVSASDKLLGVLCFAAYVAALALVDAIERSGS